MKNHWLIFLFSLLILIPAYGQEKIKQLEIPATNSSDKVIQHAGYSFLYSEKHEQSIWVAYELTEAKTKKSFERTNKFISDPMVLTGTATNKDYEASGYDRGHLAPAADMAWSEKSMAESFYFSNMSPQEPGFNRGIWKQLEELTRNWAERNGSIYVVTGPVLCDGLKNIGTNCVSVPQYFYKVILDYTQPEIKAIGFIFPNKASKDSLQHFAVSIDSVESFSGIDFFPKLEDKEEATIEKTLCISCWNWKVLPKTDEGISRYRNIPISRSPVQEEPQQAKAPEMKAVPVKKKTPVQCLAKTKSGTRCKNKTANASGKCHLHTT